MTTSTTNAEEQAESLPDFKPADFDLLDPPDCDMIMKGGVTSGIVYPYAILQIATKYRLRSIGGTSAGAIAAAFAAAAEYGRQNGRPDSFVVLKTYCDELPDRLLSLFQPATELKAAADIAKTAISAGGRRQLLRRSAWHGLPFAALGAALLGLPAALVGDSVYSIGLLGIVGGVAGGLLGAARWAWGTVGRPLRNALRDLPSHGYGICSGLTQEAGLPGLTDWMHGALQHIAFGDPNHPEPLCFGHLIGPDPERPIIDLKVVTTNLSMRRPHTLPRLGAPAGFMKPEWDRLFPRAVMDHLVSGENRRWRRYAGAWRFPAQDRLPVLVAVRMSLSFPLLFSAVPLRMEDMELPSIVKSLGGKPYKRIRTVHFSDGGISSNFPIHMFDGILPSRPTFAFSLEELLWDTGEVTSRVALPTSAGQAMGVQIKEITRLSEFAWQILSSAKDWQDQMLSEITGQRERIVRIFLSPHEGGLNLGMSPKVVRHLMSWGYEAGRRFTDGGFDFDEHRWRRLLVLYKHLDENLGALERIWSGGYGAWYQDYHPMKPKSYRALTKGNRKRIAETMDALSQAHRDLSKLAGPLLSKRLPKKAGTFRVAPKF